MIFYNQVYQYTDKKEKNRIRIIEINDDVAYNEISETVQEFQIRRCCIVIDRMLEEDNVVRFEKLRESCAIESKNFKKIKPYLEEYISEKQKKN